jgi:hypothetical protein
VGPKKKKDRANAVEDTWQAAAGLSVYHEIEHKQDLGLPLESVDTTMKVQSFFPLRKNVDLRDWIL